MAKLTLTTITSMGNETSFLSALEANYQAIIAAVENTLSRDGTTPNEMSADLDLALNDLLNVVNLNSNAGQCPMYTQAQIDALFPLTGQIVYNLDTQRYNAWDVIGAVWKVLSWS